MIIFYDCPVRYFYVLLDSRQQSDDRKWGQGERESRGMTLHAAHMRGRSAVIYPMSLNQADGGKSVLCCIPVPIPPYYLACQKMI